jgi:soluble lytic murein transglycosylase-like protein
VNVDDTVVESLNRILADRDLRAQVRAGLERLDRYRAVALPVLERTGLPAALLALPLAESRVQPLQPGTNRMKSAGIWQFIPATARLYGLRVDETLDERYDVFREVEAAAAYLRDLYAHYGEWPLAIAAYNFGSSNVDAAIAKAGTRDVGALRKAGALNGYTSTVLASMLVMQRPALVDR